MNAKCLNKFRARLRSMLDRLDGEVDQLAETVRLKSQPIGEHDQVVSENVDKDLALEQNEARLRSQVLEALRRCDEGRFGVCEDCGMPIDSERLDVLPHAAKCVHCERRNESVESLA